MERIHRFRASIQRIIESPRAPVLWSIILCVFTLTFLAQVISASYVYTTVRVGMEGQKTQQEKKIDKDVLRIYDPEEFKDVQVFIEERAKQFTRELEKRALPEPVPEKIKSKTKAEEVIEPDEVSPAIAPDVQLR